MTSNSTPAEIAQVISARFSEPDLIPAGLDLVEVRLHPELFPRVCKVGIAQGRKTLRNIITGVAMYRGMKADELDLDYVTANLLNEIIADGQHLGLKYITFEEIAWQLKRAALNQTKRELYGINVGNLYAQLVDYAKEEGTRNDRAAAARRNSPKFNKSYNAIIAAYAARLINPETK